MRDATDAVMRAVAGGPEGEAPQRMLVGFSGGLDSTVLLHALAAMHPGKVRALHVHHGLHAHADDWAKHCERLCAQLGVPLAIERVQVVDVDAGPEAAARHARHAAFRAHLGDGEWLALAHHRDDQAETFLLRALRASGPDGLAAMRAKRAFGAGWMWRPLLGIARDTLRAYADAHALAWIDDPSNASTDFDRNFLRHRVMPLLRERWPQLDAAFAQSARLAAQASDSLAQHDAQHAFDTDAPMLALDRLRALSAAARARAVRAWIDAQHLPPAPARLIEWVEAELMQASGDGASECRWAGRVLRRWRDALFIADGPAALPADFETDWDGRTPLQLPNGLRWHLRGARAFDAPMQVRARRGGERIRLPARTHHHALKEVLRSADIPPWQRAAWPVLLDADGRVLACGDIHAAPLTDWLRAQAAQLRLAHD